MSRLILYLARTLEPPPVNATVEVVGVATDDTARPVSARVVGIDASGITVELTTSEFGCLIWHFDLPQMK